MADSVDQDQTASIGAVCSVSTLFTYILNSSVMLGNYLQQTTSADNISDAFFPGSSRTCCRLAASVLSLFFVVPWIGLQGVIVVFPGHGTFGRAFTNVQTPQNLDSDNDYM